MRVSSRPLGVPLAALLALASVAPVVAQEPLRVGVIKYKTIEDVESTYTPLVGYIAERLGREPQLEIVPAEELAFRLSHGQYDIGIFTPFPYLDARLNFPELEVFASHIVDGARTYQGTILVRKDSGIANLNDLTGKSFHFVKPTSTSGFKYPEGVFREHGIDITTDLTFDFSGGHAESLELLLTGGTDGIAIDSKALDKLAVDQLRRLETLEKYELPYHAYVFAPTVDPQTRQRIEGVMFNAFKDPEARTVFQNSLGIQRWERRLDTDYNRLRRYLGMLRSKPTLAVRIAARASAEEELRKRGDVLDVLHDSLRDRLRATGRFSPVDESATATHTLELVIGRVGDLYHYLLSLDGEVADSSDLAEAQLTSYLPRRVTDQVLSTYPIEAALFLGARWFITYGSNDGLAADDYDFFVRPPAGVTLPLAAEAIDEITPLNTFFRVQGAFERGAVIEARYRPQVTAPPPGPGSKGDAEAGVWSTFWQNLDNRWGVIGLLAALLTVGVGSWLTRRKKRRFKSVLNETLHLLKLYIEGKYDLATQVLAQRDKIHRYLDRGYINENQYLILKGHIDEVEKVIRKLDRDAPGQNAELDTQLREVLEDGKITQEELAQLAELVRRQDAPGDDRPPPKPPDTDPN